MSLFIDPAWLEDEQTDEEKAAAFARTLPAVYDVEGVPYLAKQLQRWMPLKDQAARNMATQLIHHFETGIAAAERAGK